MVEVLFNAFMLVFAIFVIYWFWLSQPKSQKIQSGKVQIIVKDGVYVPSSLSFNENQNIELEFIREDESSCSEIVVFKNLDKQFQLPYKKILSINLGKLPKGLYKFTCQMNMYQGSINVK
ncbi:MAG: cupredoxin domain-containing protein [Gammaproteobacteria bacterium]|nr:MAG: cupredoxin domain-containing protein [Gammaproteobacteria bacterium]